jgi:hypothetical protein
MSIDWLNLISKTLQDVKIKDNLELSSLFVPEIKGTILSHNVI